MKVVVLESFAMNPGDLDWGGLHAIAQQVDFWPRTAQGDIIPRIQGAEVIILNKCRVDEALLAASPSLRWIGVTGTGTDMIDIDACRRHNVAVANVPGYSTESVAQHTFALLLELTNATGQRSQTVRDGHWQVDVPASYGIQNHTELWGKTFGVVGYGAIGKAAARIANGFGMKVLAYARTLRDEYKADGVEFVPLNELLQRCDIISLHCPATPETNKMIGPAELAQMKQGAILLNTARGALIDEEAVAKFAKNGHILYGADAVVGEPITRQNPLFCAPGVLITPHMAWATTEALARLTGEVCENLSAYVQGRARNLVT